MGRPQTPGEGDPEGTLCSSHSTMLSCIKTTWELHVCVCVCVCARARVCVHVRGHPVVFV